MTVLQIDNDSLSRTKSLLDNLTDARGKETITDGEISSNQSDLAKDYGRLRDCRDNQNTAKVQIASLEKALAGWTAYLDYQERREPGLTHRYELKRDYIRAAEDEQTGNL